MRALLCLCAATSEIVLAEVRCQCQRSRVRTHGLIRHFDLALVVERRSDLKFWYWKKMHRWKTLQSWEASERFHSRVAVCAASQGFEVAWVSLLDRAGRRRPLKPLRMARVGCKASFGSKGLMLVFWERGPRRLVKNFVLCWSIVAETGKPNSKVKYSVTRSARSSLARYKLSKSRWNRR